MKKNYVLDTNALLEDPTCIELLRSGDENAIGIPLQVLLELDRLKKEPRVQHLVAQAVDTLARNSDSIQILRNGKQYAPDTPAELILLEEIQSGGMPNPILVTNDRILQLLAKSAGLESQEFQNANPFQSDSQQCTGFVERDEDLYPNCFRWEEGRPMFYGAKENRTIDYEHEVWKVRPRSVYQNLALELMQNEHIDIVTVQSEAGYGKTFLALAAALYLTLERKLYEKIYVVKPMVEIGGSMGFLPGTVADKMEPYIRYMHALVGKLHSQRPANRIFAGENISGGLRQFDASKFEVLPLAFIRGMNIEDAIVIVDETQNLSRTEARALLTRMGENVKCWCLGDTRQVDNPYLNESNNALNWIVRAFKGLPNYAHLVLKGHRSRGPICDAVLKSGL